MIITLERDITWVDKNGYPTDRAASYIEELTRQVNFNTIAEGIGSPEGVLEAPPGKLYRDSTGTTGNILYIKNTGFSDTGWILV